MINENQLEIILEDEYQRKWANFSFLMKRRMKHIEDMIYNTMGAILPSDYAQDEYVVAILNDVSYDLSEELNFDYNTDESDWAFIFIKDNFSDIINQYYKENA